LFSLWVQSDLSFIGHDDITEYGRRFAEVKERLPSHGVVGYRPNGAAVTHQQLLFGNPDDLRAWFLTQYFLAPVIVSPQLGTRLIIINYSVAPAAGSADPITTIRNFEDGTKVFDFGNGVQLLQRVLE